LFRGDYADLDKCPKCDYDRYNKKKDGRDDNNADDENEPGEIRGKKKAGMKKTERSLTIRKMASLGTSQMQRNGVTLIPTSHGLTTQGAYSLL
jgi:hypothetical protein